MVVRSRVLRVAASVATVVGAMLLALTFILREYSYRFQPDLIHALMYPVPAVVVMALLAGALVAGGLSYAFVDGNSRSRRIVAGVALALLPPALLVAAWLWWWD